VSALVWQETLRFFRNHWDPPSDREHRLRPKGLSTALPQSSAIPSEVQPVMQVAVPHQSGTLSSGSSYASARVNQTATETTSAAAEFLKGVRLLQMQHESA
jgi:hypothetical protein